MTNWIGDICDIDALPVVLPEHHMRWGSPDNMPPAAQYWKMRLQQDAVTENMRRQVGMMQRPIDMIQVAHFRVPDHRER